MPDPSPLARGVATLTGNLFWVLGTVLFGTLAILLAWVPPPGWLVYGCARLWSRGVLAASGVRLRSAFAEPLEPGRPYVFMANHQSMYDIPALIACLPGQTRFLAKRSIFQIPILGWAIRLGGFVPVDREDRSRARETFAAAVDRLAAGNSLVVFPEETRSPDGRLLPFKKGGFLLALKSGLPIVPVGLRGTAQVRRKGGWGINPIAVEVRYGRPLDVGAYGLRGRAELMGEVRRRLAELAGVEPSLQPPTLAAGAAAPTSRAEPIR